MQTDNVTQSWLHAGFFPGAETFISLAEERVWLLGHTLTCYEGKAPLLDRDNFIGEWQVFKGALK